MKPKPEPVKPPEPKTSKADNFSHDWSRSGMVNYTVENPPFTGIARTLVCFYNQGHNNFRIQTLYIEKGKVVKAEFSDPYMLIEAIQKLDHWNYLSSLHLNGNWKDGLALSK